MNAGELITAVQNTVDDSSFSHDDILALLNECVLDIAGGGERVHGRALIAPLPELFTEFELTLATDDYKISLPSTYHRGLKGVFNPSTGEEIKHDDSIIRLLKITEGFSKTGVVERYLIKGNIFYYAPTPNTSTTLKAFGYRLPVDMAEDTDEPDGIPVHLQKRLLYNYACRECFSLIEQGISGAVPDTAKHDRFYQNALTDLERLIGHEDREPMFVYDDGDYIR